jgi:uncharacterized Zn finger protein (UPF0148 family)
MKSCSLCGGSIFQVKEGYVCPECNTEFDNLGNIVGDAYPEDDKLQRHGLKEK